MNDVEYQSLIDRDVAHMLHPQYLSGDQRKAIIFEKGEGSVLTDVRGREYFDGLSSLWLVWLTAFVLAQALRYWAIASLGRRWNTRVLVLPGAALVRTGPYRWLRHPNYVAVVIELAAVPLLFDAVWTAAIVGALNLALLLGVRIPCENRALS